MPMKNILVHLDHSHRSAVRLELAAALARQHEARLVGLFAESGKPHSIGVVAVWPSDAYKESAARSQAAFERAAAGLPGAEWRDANRGGAQEVIHGVIEAAHHFDIAILGQDAGDGPSVVPSGLAEQVVLNAGRPCLVIPYAGAVETIGRRPLIAWNHSRESARALNDALPLIAGCEAATVVTFAAHPNDEKAAARDCLRHLEAHGIDATVECLVADGLGVMDLLLNHLVDTGSDLLVMGAHGHIGFPYLHRGGGTRHILSHMTVPVLMSH